MVQTAAAMGAEEGFNRRRIRVGLAIVGVVTLVALVLALVISSPVGRAIMCETHPTPRDQRW